MNHHDYFTFSEVLYWVRLKRDLIELVLGRTAKSKLSKRGSDQQKDKNIQYLP